MTASSLAKRLGKVAVLMGGTSFEREISLLSGKNVLEILKNNHIDAKPFDLDKNLIQKLADQKIDHVFIALHGKTGEDGSIQGALEIADIPYTGSGVLASALGMNKHLSKLIWKSNELSTPDFQVFQNKQDFLNFNFHNDSYIVKPASSGSSLGVTVINHPKKLEEAYLLASKYDKQIIIENYIKGEEFTVVVLDETVFPPVHISTPLNFYNYEAKYLSEETKCSNQTGLSKNEETEIKETAYKAYRLLGCQGCARIDFIRDLSGVFWLLEINTIPAFRENSVMRHATEAVHMPFSEFIIKILESTLV